jgi:transcriptional regulator with XRE-family HTH domain
MQAKSITDFLAGYVADMKTAKSERSDFGERVRAAREAAGLSQREVAAQLGIAQPSYALWEKNHVALRPDQLLKLSGILSVRVEELLDPPSASNRRGGPAGKAKRAFEAVSQLPRARQQKILEVVEALIAQHGKPA